MTAIKEYIAAQTLEELTEAMSSGKATLLAGGTDLAPRWSRGITERPDIVVDVKRVDGLHGISRTNGGVSIGACTLMSEIEDDPLIHSTAPVLASAASRIACAQIRNRATIGGNLCNASPAADTAIPLLLIDAVLDLASSGRDGINVREVAIGDFFRGPGITVLEPGEVLVRVQFRPLSKEWFAAWDKFGTRPAMEIAVASVGLALNLANGTVVDARVGYGSVAPVPLRGRRAEAELKGHSLTESVMDKCVAAARGEIEPITDLRASAEYRREVVGAMLRRMLQHAQRTQQS
ncbi:MAG: FAD binding domain-containing protein [Planctomycetota bacterium]|jgi:CO/xanthine dehydrogenase FAD-binding subunit